MIKGVAFQTKARTVDHLGREQIADCPTAISELWKNAYDAYARTVELDIYDGEEPVAAIVDDGHGMNREEFISRWLVVGTESKATVETTPTADRNNLAVRQRQGQKGIGRLSCANLGPVLLFISKRKNSSFVAALVDWRLFENPFINLSDIEIPVVEFEEKTQLFELIPELVESLSQNVTGGQNDERAQRLRSAWKAYDDLYRQEIEDESNNKLQAPSLDIISAAARVMIDVRHLEQWPVWSGNSEHGTALVISQINFDLRAQLDDKIGDLAARTSREKFFETLSSFVDPFVDLSNLQLVSKDPQFSYLVRAWEGQHSRIIVGSDKQFDRRLLDGMEHRIEGKIGPDGVFRGRVRAFGAWSSDDCVIEPPNDLLIPLRADSLVGPFELYIASMEFLAANSSHSAMDWQRYSELAVKYAGLMLFRDGLRVMPFGRTDNDFFGIEERRSKNAGREFWNHRQMFGRLAITRHSNPNLKDKAGREGLLDNRAAKILKALVENILGLSARRYFGRASQLRDEYLPQIQDRNKRERANEARNKLRKRQRSEFRTKLQNHSRELPEFVRQVESFSQNLNIASESQIVEAQSQLEVFRERLEDFGLSGPPKDLGSLEEPYAEYRSIMRSTNDAVTKLSGDIDRQIELINPAKPRDLLEKQLSRNAAQIHHRIQGWKRSIDSLQKAEFARIRELIELRNKLFHAEALPS